MLSMADSGAVEPEDRELIEKLAKLQQMYNQIGGLRTLLPEKLINPARFALDNPGGYNPEKLATYMQTAAQAGSRDVERFKKDWHSDDVRELWLTVNANDFPQGGDAWAFDYGGLLQNAATTEQPSTMGNGASQEVQALGDAEIAKLVNDFRARHPELKIHVSDEAGLLPIDISVAQLGFRVEKGGSASVTEYSVSGDPFTETTILRDEILQSLRDLNGNGGLTGLLETIAAFRDIMTRPCDKCNKLVHSNGLQLPLVRRQKPTGDGAQPQFLALHRDCV